MIEFKNVSKKYKDKVALSNCSLQIPKGQIIGLFGANGAGKTTFMKCMIPKIKEFIDEDLSLSPIVIGPWVDFDDDYEEG